MVTSPNALCRTRVGLETSCYGYTSVVLEVPYVGPRMGSCLEAARSRFKVISTSLNLITSGLNRIIYNIGLHIF